VSVLLVTGTGTGVGKTVTTAAVVACATGRVAVVKPAQTGVAAGEPGDLAEVTRLTGCTDTHEFARYPEPLSPHHAAARSGRAELDLDDVAAQIADLAAARDLVVVEGAGGLLVPFAATGWTIADLAAELDAPLLVVTNPGLGTLNHTALTLQAMVGLECAGLVIGSWPREPAVAELCNVEDLAEMAELVGVLPADSAAVTDFPAHARAALGPRLGGVFDAPAFQASCVRIEGES
jgi:dethiobiotin synthetase